MQTVLGNLVSFLQGNQWISYLLLIWTIPWKGLALWKSAQKKQVYWFVAFLVVNTVGLLEIVYIFIFSKMEKKAIVSEGREKSAGEPAAVEEGKEGAGAAGEDKVK